jgi:hypothetical protein
MAFGKMGSCDKRKRLGQSIVCNKTWNIASSIPNKKSQACQSRGAQSVHQREGLLDVLSRAFAYPARPIKSSKSGEYMHHIDPSSATTTGAGT